MHKFNSYVNDFTNDHICNTFAFKINDYLLAINLYFRDTVSFYFKFVIPYAMLQHIVDF